MTNVFPLKLTLEYDAATITYWYDHESSLYIGEIARNEGPIEYFTCKDKEKIKYLPFLDVSYYVELEGFVIEWWTREDNMFYGTLEVDGKLLHSCKHKHLDGLWNKLKKHIPDDLHEEFEEYL